MTGSWISAEWPAPENIVAGTTLRELMFAANKIDGLHESQRPCWLQQVHGSTVVVADDYPVAPEADGCVSTADNRICVVRTADCLPVLLCSQDGSAFAAAHAGWRGLAGGVLENTVAAMPAEPSKIVAWLGPAISQPSFEVGGEVRAAFIAVDAGSGASFSENERGRWQADLYALARRRLALAGVTDCHGGGACTFLDDSRFFSYRRNPDCGRMVSFIARTSP